MLQYYGGEVFGLVIDNPRKLANPILSYMVVCMFGEQKFCTGLFPESAVSVSEDLIKELIHIGGYLTAKSKNKDLDDSQFYYEKYHSFMAGLNQGGQHILGDSVRQWVIYSSVW